MAKKIKVSLKKKKIKKQPATAKSRSKIEVPDNPFEQEILNRIFRISEEQPDRLISRESSKLEFKETFNWGSKDKYAKTFAAFANSKGGYLVFGVCDNPRALCGLTGNNFEKIDSGKITEYINGILSPELSWDMHLYKFRGKNFGIIYISEATNKPIVSTKNDGEIKEAEIYYRYHGRTEKIKYPELRNILEEKRIREQDHWLKYLKQIARIGVENAGILDISSGKVTGSSGSFLIDESLLPKIKFIREGSFDEVDGIPAIKIIGKAEQIDEKKLHPTRIVVTRQGIRTADIFHAFFDQEDISEPEEFIKAVCFESSAFMPIYYFMNKAKLNIKQTIDLITPIISRFQSKKRLLGRLNNDVQFYLPINNVSDASRKRKIYREDILKKRAAIDLQPEELKYLLQAIRSLKKEEIDTSYIFPLLKKFFEDYYSKESNIAFEIRYTVCYIDLVLNKKDV